MAKIYLDLDGCITNFDKAIEKIGVSKKDGAKFWVTINKAGTKFWSEMEWMPDGKQLWKAVEIYKPTILTAPSNHKDSITGKKEWLDKNLPEVPYLIDQDKAAHAGKNKILIDDREKNIKKWEEAGGIGILHKDAKTTIDKLNRALGSIEKTAMAESTPKTPPKVPWYPKDVRGGRPDKIVVPKKGPGSFKREKDWRKGIVAMSIVTEKLDLLASTLESKGLVKQATEIDVISNTLDSCMETEAKVLPHTKDRPAAIFPKESPKVKDDKDHFPIPDKNHGQNALARVNQYGEVPSWYDGSLSELKAAVVRAVKGKFPGIEVEEEKFKPEE
jgi:5'(3')-deoxyribonucleotidase